MNVVILTGRLCADVELKHTASGTAVASYRLAVDRRYKREGQPDADFFNCVTWGKNAEFASKHLRKGVKIAVEGELQSRTYEDKDGKTVYVTEVIVQSHEFCEKKSDSSGGNSYGGNTGPGSVATSESYATQTSDFEEIPTSDDDLPF